MGDEQATRDDAAQTERSRPGPESTLADVRAQLIDAATDTLLRDGVDMGLGRIVLSDVIARAGVSRATAYRSLASDTLEPQEELRYEVLRRMLNRDSREANQEVITTAVAAELEHQAQNAASTDIALRTHAMRSLMRVGGAASYHNVVASRERAILVAAYGAERSQPTTDSWKAAALTEGERGVQMMLNDTYSSLSKLFGYRLKPQYEMEQFSTAAASLVEGIAMRHGFNDNLDHIVRPTGPGGADEDWTLYAVGFEGLFLTFFEIISPEAPIADLANY